MRFPSPHRRRRTKMRKRSVRERFTDLHTAHSRRVQMLATLPRYHGCADASSLALPYCNASLPWAERVADIVPRLNVTEKIGLLSPHDPPNYCRCVAQPVPRIGLPGWQWLTEVNSDVINCLHGRCGISFVGPAGIAASFNRSSWWAKGDVLSTEISVHKQI